MNASIAPVASIASIASRTSASISIDPESLAASIVAPAGTPDPVIARLNTEFTKALRSTEIRDKWQAMGFEALPSTPDEFTRFAQAESRRWAEAVKISGFKASE